jgi:catechol 2,3-dioxygenase-like lactoylglutathione lyase family enzyme
MPAMMRHFRAEYDLYSLYGDHMTASAAVQLASVRLITEDIPRLVRFYQALTGATPQYLTEDFVELVTPSATVAVSGSARVAFITTDTPRAGANSSAIVEFLVEDTDAVYKRLATEFGDDLDVVQPPTVMPWGNLSALVRDPDGSLVNLYTPVTPEAWQLQRNRTPKPPHAGR